MEQAPVIARSARADVRNPMLKLPEVREAFVALTPEARAALVVMLRAVSKQCRANGDLAWRKHKPPMAAYWKAQAVYARHLALAGVVALAACGGSQAPEDPPAPKCTAVAPPPGKASASEVCP